MRKNSDKHQAYLESASGTIVDALRQRNIPIIPLSGKKPAVSQSGYGINQIRRCYSDINDASGYLISINKEVTKGVLERNNIPVPSGVKVENEEELLNALPRLQFPIVIKPTDSIWGQGVTTNIQTKEEAVTAYKRLQESFDSILVEEHVQGHDYRVLVLGDKVIAAMKRLPARVKGDGENTIEKLIDAENKKREEILKSQRYALKPITVDGMTGAILDSQGYNLQSVPKKDEDIALRMNANLKSGGEGVDVTKTVHPENKDLCRKITRILGLKIAGIDILAPAIDKPFVTSSGKVTEVNNNPDIDMHIYPHQGESIDTAGMLADFLFPDPEKAWIPIQIDGKLCRSQEIVDKHLGTIPKRVTQRANADDRQEIEIERPVDILLTYLLDPFTISVVVS